MVRHLVARPESVPETLAQFKGAKIVVLSRREVIPSWKATKWLYSENLDTLCKRFRTMQTRQDQAYNWVVVVDMVDQVPTGKGYNKLFKKKPDVNVVTVSEDKHVLRDHRFENHEVKPKPAPYVDLADDETCTEAANQGEPSTGWFGGWF